MDIGESLAVNMLILSRQIVSCLGPMLWHRPVISVTLEAEEGGLL